MVAIAAFSQVSMDNEDGVAKIDAMRARHDFVPGQVLVKFSDGNRVTLSRSRGMVTTNLSRVSNVLSKYGVGEMEQLLPNENPKRQLRKSRAFNGETIQERDLSQLYLISLSDDHAEEAVQMIEELNALEEVEFAEPNYRVYTLADDNIAADYNNNPMTSQQWYLDAYGVKELWNKPIINKARPVIAIIDTGVDITHPDLKDNIWTNQAEADGRDDYDNDRNGFKNDVHGWDFINNTAKMRDNNSHGTHVAGIAAAANNGLGIVGANPRALIMPVTVMQSDGTGNVATIIKGIDYAVKSGATVLNLSLGAYSNSSSLRQSLENAYQKAVIVAAAGNDVLCIYASHCPKTHREPASPCFPAAYSFVLGVQATSDALGTLASFSNYDDDGPLFSCESSKLEPDGYNYELKAPGTRILSTIPGGSYKDLQGTSMAAPLVAGAISALKMVKEYDNQELLWGDLLHANNIAQAYDQISRPAELDIMRVMTRERKELANETEEEYKSNNEVNTGEVVSIYPVIRTTFGKASNIKIKIENCSGMQIISGETDFGYSLDAFGKGVSKTPLIVKINENMPNASTADLTIVATCNESSKTFSCPISFNVCNMYTLKGLFTEDIALSSNHVYYVISDVGIAEGSTMTIEPGTRIELAPNTSITSFGVLNAHGTPERPIVFARHDPNELSNSSYSVNGHTPSGKQSFNQAIYTNSSQTLFTVLPTNDTPLQLSSKDNTYWYNKSGFNPSKLFYISDYIEDWQEDFTGKEDLLTDPTWLTPAVLRLLEDWKAYCEECDNLYPKKSTSSQDYPATVRAVLTLKYAIYKHPASIFSYCIFDRVDVGSNYKYLPNCLIRQDQDYFWTVSKDTKFNFGNYRNLVNGAAAQYDALSEDNYFNNLTSQWFSNKFRPYSMWVNSSNPGEVSLKHPCYLGSAKEDVIRPYLCEYGNVSDGLPSYYRDTYATLNLDNILKEPIKEAHGIVWKVLVNGVDPQDEQDILLPLGVGRYKFEVYFNRPMNKSVEPQISFGPLPPYTKKQVAEDGEWNKTGTVYTAYVTIDGKTQCDGMNRIYVRGAEDNEFFPCPYEATRFNIMVQASGSLASGFQAEAGLGCVNLKWNNENNDFEDAMGFNVYRYTEGEGGVNDTIRINDDIIDISATSYIDDKVTPGQTYYYYYKVLSTALQEYDISNVVAATPLTATRGDANGSGSVDVVDVISTVNYITGMSPKPFVFQAADMDSNQLIDIFDVVGIIQGILNPSLLATASLDCATATYFIEDGTLYVESSASLAGLQVQLISEDNRSITLSEDLDSFETASAWLSDSDFLFMAYSMSNNTLAPGRHALLHIGDAKLASLRLSDTVGHKISITEKGSETTDVDSFRRNVVSGHGVYDLSGRKVTTADRQEILPRGVYIINGKKVVK